MGAERRHLRVPLPLAHPPAAGARCEPLAWATIPDLSTLLLEAYRGTTDDEGEDYPAAVREVERILSGRSGDVMWPHSLVCRDRSGRVVAAAWVTHWRGFPLISHVVTHPSVQRRGYGEALLCQAAASLQGAGYSELRLWVTKGNHPAERLYQRLGFQDLPVEAPR